MIHIFIGTDTKKGLAALNTAVSKAKLPVIHVSDASSLDDIRAALAGGGMFGESRAVVLDRLSDNEVLWQLVIDSLPHLAQQNDSYFIYEEKADAATKKILQKYAKNVEVFDAPKSAKPRPTVFSLVNYMQAGDKKKLWVAYQGELLSGNAPEAIHGVLFWGVKQALLGARNARDVQRSRRLIAELAELPHESRRRGEELEYALERYILTNV